MEKSQEPVGRLLKDLRDETQELIREEVALVKAELREKMHATVRMLTAIGIGTVLVLVGLIELVATANRGLTAILDGAMSVDTAIWLAPLLIGATFLAIGAVMLSRATHGLKPHLKPERTVASLKDTKQWATQHARTQRRGT